MYGLLGLEAACEAIAAETRAIFIGLPNGDKDPVLGSVVSDDMVSKYGCEVPGASSDGVRPGSSEANDDGIASGIFARADWTDSQVTNRIQGVSAGMAGIERCERRGLVALRAVARKTFGS